MSRWLPVALLLFLICMLAPHPVPAEGPVKMTLRACIDKALVNHPTVRSSAGSLDAARSKVMQSSSPYYPQINASAGYSESHSTGAFGDSVTKGNTATLSLNQLLYDFGRTGGSRDAAQAGLRSAEFDRDRSLQEIVLDVKQAYYGLLLADKLLLVAQKTLEQAESHLRQAEAFFRSGSKPRFDVTRAEVDVNNAQLGLLNAKNSRRLSIISLNTAIGVDPASPIEIEDIAGVPEPMPSLDTAQLEALRTRPEMQKASSDLELSHARVRSEQAGYFPTITANGSHSWSNGTAEMGMFKGELGDSWNAGVTLNLPLFEGGVTRGRVSEARASVLTAEAQRDSLKQVILLEVNRAYADYENAVARIEVMGSSVRKAREYLDIAQGRYQAGVGPFIEVTDAQVAAVKAETDEVQARYDLLLAIAKLRKAMGLSVI